jgi:hypothetical protein
MKTYKNDYGMILIVDTKTDLTTAVGFKFIVKKPDGTEVEWNAIIHDETKMKYTIQAGDLDQEGVYEINSFAEFPGFGTGETFEWEIFRRYN